MTTVLIIFGIFVVASTVAYAVVNNKKTNKSKDDARFVGDHCPWCGKHKEHSI